MVTFEDFNSKSEKDKAEVNFNLDLASELIQKHVHIRANLPAKLAELAVSGREEDALKLLISWGTGAKTLTQLWEEVNGYIEKP